MKLNVMQRSMASQEAWILVRSRSCTFATTSLAATRRGKTEQPNTVPMKRLRAPPPKLKLGAPQRRLVDAAPPATMALPPLWVADEVDDEEEDCRDHDGARVARWMNERWAELRAEGERQRAIRDKADREVRAALARVRDLQAQRLRGRTNKAGLPTLD
jgi:uncharacterized protein YecT (DUF1311 family)